MPETATKAKSGKKAATAATKPRRVFEGTAQGKAACCRAEAVVAVTDHGPEGFATLHLSTGMLIQVPGFFGDLMAELFGGAQ